MRIAVALAAIHLGEHVRLVALFAVAFVAGLGLGVHGEDRLEGLVQVLVQERDGLGHRVGGHAGASDNKQVARVQALIYSYLWDQLKETAAQK